MNMKTLSYTVRFLTPAFLGNADQTGQWRTPPFKALLRQWWRVAVAQDLKFNVDALRKREADLFGVAADGADSHKSLIRIRLSRWDEGKLKSWSGDTPVKHDEVPKPVGAQLYLGYGALVFKGGTALKSNAAIQSGEEAILRIAFPEIYAHELETALWLMDRYGAIGGRSRNGWGSFSLSPADSASKLPEPVKKTVRDWKDALELDWPHAIGKDKKDNHGALVWQTLAWQTSALNDWKSVMTELAKIKIGLRTQFKFNSGKNAPAPEKRHWLSYPVTNHSVAPWGNNARLPNSLRFKVRQDADDKLRGVIFHVPCKPSPQFRPDAQAIQAVWQQVHQYLDGNPSTPRIAE
jgi:CRISPR-associated protein Cmr1